MEEMQVKKKKYKTTHILGIIFLVLLGMALIFGDWFGENEAKEKILYKADADKISKIEIIRGGEEGERIVLNKEVDGSWTVGEEAAPADMVYVGAILVDLEEVRVKEEAVSENPEKQGIYEVDETGVEVVVYKGDKVLADFFLGKFGPDFNSSYIRKKDSKKVYLTLENIGGDFGRASYKEMTMLKFDMEEVEKLRIKHDDADFEMIKSGEEWKSGDKVLDSVKIDDFLRILSNYRGQDVVRIEEDEETGFDAPPLEVVVTLAGGAQKVLTVGLGYPNVATYYSKSSDSDKVYLITQWQRDELKKQLEDFE